MGRLESIRIFTRVAETNSFSKAADAMEIPRGTVSRIVQTLEDEVGVRLLNRSTRRVSLTEAGKRYYDRCIKVIADLSEVEAELSNVKNTPSGIVRVDTYGSIVRSLLVPGINAFFKKYPDIEVRVGLGDRNVDLIQEGVDCVIRAGALEESSLVARRIGNAKRVTCAAPAYLEAHGIPSSIEALDAHYVVNYFGARSGKLVPFEFDRDGQIIKLTLRSKFAVNEGTAYIDAGVGGLGIIQPSRYLVSDLLKQGVLREILSKHRAPPIPISIVYPHRTHISSATRAFTDWITDTCRRNPDLKG